MTDWYYHDPAEGRVGPLTAKALRKRFQDRRLQRDKLRRKAQVDVRSANIDGGCAFAITVAVDGRPMKTLRYEGFRDGDAFAWQCAGDDMPDAYRPYECRNG